MGCFSHVVATLLVQQGSRATGMSHAFHEVSVENGGGGGGVGGRGEGLDSQRIGGIPLSR